MRNVAARFAAMALIFAAAACAHCSSADRNSESASASDLFAGRSVLRIEIATAAQRNRELPPNWHESRAEATLARVREGGRLYTNVALHLKGGAGSFRPFNDNPGLTLNFEKYAPGQTFHGLRKLSLNNSVQDPSFLNDIICRELVNRAGVPTPRAALTLVRLNGRELGIHVLTEGFNKQFLRHYFTNVSGNLYQTHGNQEVTDHLDVNSGDDPTNDSGLRALAKAVDEPDPAVRWKRLNQTLDLDRFVSFMAMEIMLCHWDGYCMNQNNYRIFHDLSANKMVFIAHGMDQMFGTGTMRLAGGKSSAECPIFPPWHGAVAEAVMSTPEGRHLYLERLGQLYTNLFKVDLLQARVDELAGKVQVALEQVGSPKARNYQVVVDDLKTHIAQRDRSLAQQLALAAKPRVPRSFAPIRVSGWAPRGQDERLHFENITMPSHAHVLHISTKRGGVGSWRCRVQLEPGRYRFEGEVQVQQVVVRENQGGAGLRISGGRAKHQMTGSADWRPFAYEFEVGNLSSVELVCELRALSGDAWFDADKLRVVPVE